MIRCYLAIAFAFLSLNTLAQGNKMPAITFQENSLAFADHNKMYSHSSEGTKTDTLKDEKIVFVLAKILEENTALLIELGGHVALNEDTLLGLERAQLVQKQLIEHGVSPDRLTVKNYAHRDPIIDQASLLALPTKVEKQAANAKNRRVEVTVVGRKKR